MNISLYVSRSDDYTQIEHVLKQLGISYTLHLKEEDPKIEPWLAVPSLSVVVINSRCTFFAPNITTEEFKALIQSCLIAENIAGTRKTPDNE